VLKRGQKYASRQRGLPRRNGSHNDFRNTYLLQKERHFSTVGCATKMGVVGAPVSVSRMVLW
jgi:hypothetical protein